MDNRITNPYYSDGWVGGVAKTYLPENHVLILKDDLWSVMDVSTGKYILKDFERINGVYNDQYIVRKRLSPHEPSNFAIEFYIRFSGKRGAGSNQRSRNTFIRQTRLSYMRALSVLWKYYEIFDLNRRLVYLRILCRIRLQNYSAREETISSLRYTDRYKPRLSFRNLSRCISLSKRP